MFFRIVSPICCVMLFFCCVIYSRSINETHRNCGKVKHGLLSWYKSVAGSVCYNFHCDNGVNKFLDYGCLDANKQCNRHPHYNYPCYINGKLFSKCSCQKKDGKFDIQRPCLDPQTNVEYGIGETWISFQNRICVTYQCSWSEYKVVQTDCRSVDGKCIRPNSGKAFKCLVSGHAKTNCFCTKSKSGQLQISFVERTATKQDAKITCQDKSNGLKYQVGEEWVSKDVEKNACAFYRCAVNNTAPYKIGCLDSERTCRVAGSTGFSCLLNGIVRPSCECKSLDDGTLLLNSLGCHDPDTQQWWDDSQSWTSRTKNRCFYRTCNAGYIEQVASCNSQNGTCFERGSQNFPCYYGETAYPQCACDYATIYPYPLQ